MEDYAAGTRRSNELSLSSISQVPITMIAGKKDPVCTNDASWRIYSELRNTERTFRQVEGAGHLYFIWATGDRFTEELVASIEGTDDSDFGIMSLWEVGQQLVQRYTHMSPKEVQTLATGVGGNVVEKYAADYGPAVGAVVVGLICLVLIAVCGCCCCLCVLCGCCGCACRACRKKEVPEGEFVRISVEDASPAVVRDSKEDGFTNTAVNKLE